MLNRLEEKVELVWHDSRAVDVMTLTANALDVSKERSHNCRVDRGRDEGRRMLASVELCSGVVV